ncbi:MAG: hypothetical protein IKS31_10870 [Clostridia bacterium]|nr:hypothetical protein [Clostridia bacterium]
MFLRKLTVIVLPLAGLAAVLHLRAWLVSLGFWGEAAAGLLCGVCLALLPRAAGAKRRRYMPFARQLLVPAVLLLALIVTQSMAIRGVHTPLPASLAAPDTAMLAAESALAGALLVTGLGG